MNRLGHMAWGLAAVVSAAAAGCETDDKATLTEAELEAARAALSGPMVVSAKTVVNGADKTLLPGGAPAKFEFVPGAGDQVTMWQDCLHIGNMPFSISLAIELRLAPVLSLEAADFPGGGWVRFSGRRGVVGYNVPRPSATVDTTTTGEGATVTGFVNVQTREIQFQIDYIAGTVQTVVERQAIDTSRVAVYDDELRQYEEDLKRYKEEHGLR